MEYIKGQALFSNNIKLKMFPFATKTSSFRVLTAALASNFLAISRNILASNAVLSTLMMS